MIKHLHLPQHNLYIVDFISVFAEIIEKPLIVELERHTLLDKRLGSDARKLFFHNCIYDLSEYSLNLKTIDRLVFYYNRNEIYQLEIAGYFDRDELTHLFDVIISKINKLLPLKIFKSDLSFDCLTSRFDGDKEEVINRLKSLISNQKSDNYTFSSIKQFAKQNNLVFLDTDYFNRFKSKQLLFA